MAFAESLIGERADEAVSGRLRSGVPFIRLSADCPFLTKLKDAIGTTGAGIGLDRSCADAYDECAYTMYGKIGGRQLGK